MCQRGIRAKQITNRRIYYIIYYLNVYIIIYSHIGRFSESFEIFGIDLLCYRPATAKCIECIPGIPFVGSLINFKILNYLRSTCLCILVYWNIITLNSSMRKYKIYWYIFRRYIYRIEKNNRKFKCWVHCIYDLYCNCILLYC